MTDTNSPILIIRGAAGSGKTTTALLRLKQLCGVWLRRKQRLGLTDPVRVLVLTFNTTLEGYIEALAEGQIAQNNNMELRVTTFAKFARDLAGDQLNLQPENCEPLLLGLCRRFEGDLDFVKDEVDYLMSRFAPDDLDDYATTPRTGRGQSPRMTGVSKRRLLEEVVIPYRDAKAELGWSDWNDLAVAAANVNAAPWDVVVVDETQDFSANQIRTVMKHVAVDHQVTFVMDAAQQIYPRGFTWQEANATPATTRLLNSNYRNTREIAAFARPLLEGLPLSEDGALPNFEATDRAGKKPVVLSGLYSQQLAWSIENVVKPAVQAGESVAFLKPRGGQWFSMVRSALSDAGIPYAELTRRATWPKGTDNVAICTLHSAKGLEFDHVVILGLSRQVTPHGEEADDTQLESLRRLIAMGVGRAKLTVTIGYKPSEESSLLSFLDPDTFEAASV